MAAAAVALAAVVYAELASGPSSASLGAAGGVRTAPAESGAGKSAAPDAGAADLDEVLARPLFTPGRQPAPGRQGPAAGGQALPFEARLVGILYSPEQREVLFADGGKGGNKALHEGESIEGWTVERISPERVTFRSGVRSATIELAQDGTPGSRPRRPPGLRGVAAPGRAPGVKTNAP